MWLLCAVFPVYLSGQPRCPSVDISENNFANCNSNGTANVFVSISLDNPSSDPDDFAIAVLECAPNGTPAGTNTVGVAAGETDVPLSVTCIYPTPSTPQPFVRFTDVNSVPLIDCPTVPVPFGPLGPCPSGCAAIESITVDTNPATPTLDPITCDFQQNGSWSIALDANINNKQSVTGGYTWTFGDSTAPVSIPASVPGAPRHIHNYECPDTGDHFVTLTLFGCAGSEFYTDSETAAVTFPSCGCPTITDIATTVNNCEVTFDATIAGGCTDAITEYIWNFDDGTTETVLPSDPGDPTTVSHTYDSTGDYDVTLTLGGVGSGCSASTVVGVTACDGSDGDNGGDCVLCFCGGLWCCLLWLLFFLLVVAAIVALAFALCDPSSTAAWIAFGIAVAGVIAAAGLLIGLCDADVCALLFVLAGSGFAGYAVVCGTNIAPCESFLCQETSIPGTGTQVDNLLLIDIAFTILVVILCAVL